MTRFLFVAGSAALILAFGVYDASQGNWLVAAFEFGVALFCSLVAIRVSLREQ